MRFGDPTKTLNRARTPRSDPSFQFRNGCGSCNLSTAQRSFMSVIEDSDTSRFPRGPAATLEDVWNCYRLLLDREPDEGGFETHAEVVRNGISVDDLWRLFVSSPEYARRTKLQFEPTVTRLP